MEGSLHAPCSRKLLRTKLRKPNEPALVVHTAAALASVKGIGPAELARITTDNFHSLYSKVPRPAAAESAG